MACSASSSASSSSGAQPSTLAACVGAPGGSRFARASVSCVCASSSAPSSMRTAYVPSSSTIVRCTKAPRSRSAASCRSPVEIRWATASVSSGATSCMSARRLASVTESWRSPGRSATRARIGSGSVSWRRRLWALTAPMPRSAQTAAIRSALAQAGAGGPAVGELRLLVGEREVLALVLLGLDAADLVGRGLVVEQQHDQAADRLQAVAGERVAGARGEQPALAGVEDDVSGRRGGGRCRARAGPWSSACGRAARCPRGRSRGARWGRARARRAGRARACPPGRRASIVVTSNSAGAGSAGASGWGMWFLSQEGRVMAAATLGVRGGCGRGARGAVARCARGPVRPGQSRAGSSSMPLA